MVYGLSLSFCVRDIALGRVAEEDVEQIISGTHYKDDEDFAFILQQYSKSYWVWDGCDPVKAVAIAQRLYDAGKILQPRATGDLPAATFDGRWCRSVRLDGKFPEARWVGKDFLDITDGK